jgi:hypothetical protein
LIQGRVIRERCDGLYAAVIVKYTKHSIWCA